MRKRKTAVRKGLVIVVINVVLIFLAIAMFANIKIITGDSQILTIGEEPQMDNQSKATLFGIDLTKFLQVDFSEVDTTKPGKYEVSYSVFGKKTTKTITVVDNRPPKIELIGPKTVKVDKIEQYSEPGYTAYDNVDGDLTGKVQVSEMKQIEANIFRIFYLVEDSSGNKTMAMRTIERPITGIIYLTFDDGPSSLTTEYLDILAEKNVQATFFVNGFSENNELKVSAVKREYEEGHTVALHGYSHVYADIYTSIEVLTDNFDSLKELIDGITGGDSKFIRFPGGSSNTVSKKYCKCIMTKAVQMAEEQGYIYFDWNVDSDDAGSSATSADSILQNVIDGVRPGRSNVILMHDSVGHTATLEALPNIIDELRTAGYEFRAITDDTPLIQHGVRN